jgi:nitrate reductase gamma subunit
VALEALLFRSLFRNSRARLCAGGTACPTFIYRPALSLWAAALLFHGCLLWVLAGHLRFFLNPAHPGPANPFVDAGLLAGLAFLFLRRVLDRRLRYLSLAADYLRLALLAAAASSGILMRWWIRANFGLLFYVHVCAACALAASLPFTKLAHMAGIFFSPTHNLRNDSRARRHVNPWSASDHGRTQA